MIFMLLLCVTFIICIIMCRHTKFARVVLLYYIGCLILVIAGILYSVNFSNYIYGSEWDYKCVRFILLLKADVYVASVLHNLGVCVLMLAATEFVNIVKPLNVKHRIAALLPVVYLFFMNFPNVRWHMYLMLNTASNAELTGNIVSVLYKIPVIAALFYYLMPMVFYIRYIFNTKIFVKKRYGITGLLSLTMVNLTIFILFIAGLFSPTMFYNMDLTSFPTGNVSVYRENTGNIILGMFILIFNMLFLVYYKPFVKSGINGFKRNMNKNDNMSKNVYMMLHTYKNRFVAIERLAKMAAVSEQEEEADKLRGFIKSIQNESEKAVFEISKILRITNPSAMEYHIFSVKECIEKALSQATISGVELKKDYSCEYDIILGSKESIVECFLNIFNNAFEAIEQKHIDKGVIEISIMSEFDMLCVSITDNGCGIPAKLINKVYQPFFTTKAQKTGNGLGLNYVKKIIRIHGGDVRIKSKNGISTSVYVALPCFDINNRKARRSNRDEVSNL